MFLYTQFHMYVFIFRIQTEGIADQAVLPPTSQQHGVVRHVPTHHWPQRRLPEETSTLQQANQLRPLGHTHHEARAAGTSLNVWCYDVWNACTINVRDVMTSEVRGR